MISKRDVYQVVEGRIKVIEKFENLVDENVKEKPSKIIFYTICGYWILLRNEGQITIREQVADGIRWCDRGSHR